MTEHYPCRTCPQAALLLQHRRGDACCVRDAELNRRTALDCACGNRLTDWHKEACWGGPNSNRSVLPNEQDLVLVKAPRHIRRASNEVVNECPIVISASTRPAAKDLPAQCLFRRARAAKPGLRRRTFDGDRSCRKFGTRAVLSTLART
jgi:hypothetical protein